MDITKKDQETRAHLDQLRDMQEHYPEVKRTLQIVINHLRGLRRVNKLPPYFQLPPNNSKMETV